MTWETQTNDQADNGWSWVLNELREAFRDVRHGLDRLQSLIEELCASQVDPGPAGQATPAQSEPTPVAGQQEAWSSFSQPDPEHQTESTAVQPHTWQPVYSESTPLGPDSWQTTPPASASGQQEDWQAPEEVGEPLAEPRAPWASTGPSTEREEVTLRDEVRRVVEQTRAEIESHPLSVFAREAAEEDIERRRHSEGFSTLDGASWLPRSQPEQAKPQGEQPRDAIWKPSHLEVENDWTAEGASSEEASASSQHAPDDGSLSQDLHSLIPSTSAHIEKEIEQRLASVAPQIMIEDPSGRVELVRVYQALARLGRAGDASLTNYTPHSVTVVLESGNAPSNTDLGAAVQDAFGRACQVSVDQLGRTVVRLLDYNARVA
jgi:hypothetical protein